VEETKKLELLADYTTDYTTSKGLSTIFLETNNIP
jgi:hypothetical protein